MGEIRDAAFLVNCIPDATVEGTPDKDHARCSVRPSLSFVRGNLDLALTVTEAVEPTSVKILGVSKGIGSGSEVESY